MSEDLHRTEFARGNDLTISVRPGGSGCEIIVDLPPAVGDLNPKPIVTTIREELLRDMNSELRRELERVRAEIGGALMNTTRSVERALAAMYGTGRLYWQQLLGGAQGGELQRLYERLGRRKGDVLNVEVKSPPDLTIPGEILPIGPRPPAGDALGWAATLPAFRAVVRHTLLSRPAGSRSTGASAGTDGGLVEQDSVLEAAHELPILFLWDASAPAAALTHRSLSAMSAERAIRLGGPYPSTSANGDTSALATLLVDPQVGEPGGEFPPVNAQVVHAHAHARVGLGRLVAGSTLIFGYTSQGVLGSARKHSVSVREIDILEALDGLGPGRRPTRGPAAFFSACGGAADVERGATGLVGLLLGSLRYRAVIGPRVDIPGTVAHNVWTSFLSGVVTHRLPVGRALYEARLSLLGKNGDGNPLGAFISLYGRADLAVPNNQAQPN